MNHLQRLVRSRDLRLPLVGFYVLLAFSALVFCFVPLLNLLSYESSLFLSVLVSILGVLFSRFVVLASLKDGVTSVPGLFGRAVGLSLLGLVLPFVILVGNGLRVQNCNYLAGLSFFVLLPVCSAMVAAATGCAAALVFGRKKRSMALGLLVVLLSFVWTGYRFLSSPAIYAYDPFFGYFPGTLYDEEVAVSAPLIYARIYHFAVVLFVIGVCVLWYSPALLPGQRRRARVFTGVFLVLGLGIFAYRGELGIHRDGRAVETVLSSEAQTEHFVLRFTPGGAVHKEIDLIKNEHEFRYRQLAATLGVEPTWRDGLVSRWLSLGNRRGKLVSYLFESSQQKQTLMGAAHTYIAKPWRKEIYLQYEAWPHPVLKHELAHVFLGASGSSVLRISMRGILPNPALIEGVAEAADWRTYKLTGHQMVSAMRESGFMPSLSRIFSLRFFLESSSRAYLTAGSFCRYLLERYGAQKLLSVYQYGSEVGFEKAYGRSFADLEGEWLRFLDTQKVPKPDREVARERLSRKAVFYKVCAHEQALRRQAAREALGKRDYTKAEKLLLAVCADDPAEPRHLFDLLDVYLAAKDETKEREVLERLRSSAELSSALRARVYTLFGDFHGRAGRLLDARAAYQKAMQLPGDESSLRLLTVKTLALDLLSQGGNRALTGRRILDLLLVDRGNVREVYGLTEALAATPDLGIVPYLLGRQLFNAGGDVEAADLLAKSLALGLPDERFSLQAARLRGQALLRAGRGPEAVTVFASILAKLPQTKETGETEGQRLELEDWISRARDWH